MLKKLMKSIREFKRDSLLAPLFVSLEVVMEVLIPFFMAVIIDVGIANGDLPYILKVGLILVISAIMSLCFGTLSGKYAARASSGFAKNLRHDMFYNIQNFSFSNIDKFSTASLVTRLTTDITNVQNAYQMIVRILIRGPLMLIFALIMAININVQLSMIFLIAIPALGISLFIIALKAYPYFEKVFKQYDKLNSVVQENVKSVRVVKAYVREDYETKKFYSISDKVYHQFKNAEKIVALNSPVMQFAMYTCILVISWIAAKLIVSTKMTTGQLMSMIVYATQILSSLMMLSMVFVMIIMAETSANRIVEVLDETSTLKNESKPIFEVPNGSIKFENVDFSYIGNNEKLVLNKINIQIKSGETVGIIGGTGSAKTTLVQLIPRLYDVTAGSIEIGNINVKRYDLDTLRNEVAMVLQQNVLFSGTIKSNLRWGNKNAADEEIIHACKLAQADDFIKGFPDGYETIIEQGGTNVSGGQKQRLCIARALLKKPKILILDDSTSAVDTKTDMMIRKALRDEIPDTTKIIIAQRINSIETADKVIVLDNGKIDAIGTPCELLKSNHIYQEIYNSQNKEESDYEI